MDQSGAYLAVRAPSRPTISATQSTVSCFQIFQLQGEGSISRCQQGKSFGALRVFDCIPDYIYIYGSGAHGFLLCERPLNDCSGLSVAFQIPHDGPVAGGDHWIP